MRRLPAEISVFFSFLCVSVCAFIYVVMYSAQTHIIKYKIEALADTSVRSCFSEYCISLLDDYGLMYVDTAYKAGDGGTESFIRHLTGYTEENIATDCNTFFKISYEDTDITDCVFASDDNYRSLKKQIRRYAEKNGILATYEEALDHYVKDFLSCKYDVKEYSVNEYEIEYIVTGQFAEPEFETEEQDDNVPGDEDVSYAEEETYISEYEYMEALSEKLSDTPYDVKLERLVSIIEINEKEKYSGNFEFGNLLESADITFYMNGNGKTYEITKSYSLTE